MSEEIDLKKTAISKETIEKSSEEFIERLNNEEEINLRKIAISKETFEKLSEDFVERLKNEEKINLVILDKADMHPKNLSHLEVSGVIMVQDEVNQYQKELELISPGMPDNETLAKQIEEMNKVFEMKNVPEVAIEYQNICEKPKQKHYVPRTIGRHNSKKKGGR